MRNHLKSKIINSLLIITSLLGYLEWGTDNRSFLFEAEYEILLKILKDPVSVFHPFTLLPMIGQLLLLVTLFQKKSNKLLTYIGMSGLAILLIFMFFIGILGLNFKIILSVIPFIAVMIIAVRHYRKLSYPK